MTFEELLETSIEQQEALSDSELEKIFEPFFNVTRPDRASKVIEARPTKEASPMKQTVKQYKEEQIAKARKLAEQFGLKLDI